MAPGSRGSRRASVRAGRRFGTALAAAGAVACVMATASSGAPLGVADHTQRPGELAAAALPMGGAATIAVPAAFLRPSAAPGLSGAPGLGATQGARAADDSPSWTGHAGSRAARAGTAGARQLSAEVLRGTAPSDLRAAALGIPGPVLSAADEMARQDPRCGVPWWLLAGIGRIESGHASGGRVDARGTTLGRILGPRLDGSTAGNAVIHDTDGGVFDGDPHFDRAVVPMQFLPSTWASVRSDGNGDGVTDPNNVYDATLGAARYLCLGGADLRTPQGLAGAVLRYNHSMDYVRSVLTWGQAYRDGDTQPVPKLSGRVPATTNPRQVPDEPPRTEQTATRHRRVAESGGQPDRHETTDQPPVLADGPRGSGSPPGSQRRPDSSSAAPDRTTPDPTAPDPTTTAPPPSSGDRSSEDGGNGSPTGTPTTTDPGGPTERPTTSPTTSPAGTGPTAGTPTNPPTTGPTSTDPPASQDPQPAAATPGEAWPAAEPAGDPAGGSYPWTTPVGTLTVSHRVLSPDATLDHEGTPTRAADGERFWVVRLQADQTPSSGATVSVTSGGTATSVPVTSGTTSVAVSVPTRAGDSGAGVVLTVATDDATWTMDVGTGAPTTTWARTAQAPADQARIASATATRGDYTAELHGLRLQQAHLTSWEPGYGAAPDASTWLVVPYTVDSAAITPEGYAESAWTPAGLTATTATGEAPAVDVDGAPAALSGDGGSLVFTVPADTSAVTVAVTPEVTVVKDGAAASDGPLQLDAALSADLRFG